MASRGIRPLDICACACRHREPQSGAAIQES
jgi:hypothetical protein